ncbi:MAG: 2,3-cyclic 3-phosphodiesterase [Actinomycetota bacterium]|nr:2,3-cyclic 3-phosphodiesterase [Actinomycetota bacterium]
MRLFVSVRPDAHVVSHLQAHLGRVRTSRPDQWHVTLAFLGEVADDVSLQALEIVARVHAPFTLRLSGSGSFGPRTTWAGVAGDVDALRSLSRDVQDACRAAGVDLEHRAYRPHLTVGRVDPRLLSSYESPTWRVEEIELVQSVLGKSAVHSVRRRFALYQA